MNCSKCEETAKHSIAVRDTEEGPPPSEEKDQRAIRIVRFCATHWHEVKDLLQAA